MKRTPEEVLEVTQHLIRNPGSFPSPVVNLVTMTARGLALRIVPASLEYDLVAIVHAGNLSVYGEGIYRVHESAREDFARHVRTSTVFLLSVFGDETGLSLRGATIVELEERKFDIALATLTSARSQFVREYDAIVQDCAQDRMVKKIEGARQK